MPSFTSKTIHLGGQRILHFVVPEELVGEINDDYEEKISTLKSYSGNLAGKIAKEHKIDEVLPNNIKSYFE